MYVLLNGNRVPSLAGIDETQVDWVANEGVRVSVLCRYFRESLAKSAFADELLAAMEGGDILSRELGAGGPPAH